MRKTYYLFLVILIAAFILPLNSLAADWPSCDHMQSGINCEADWLVGGVCLTTAQGNAANTACGANAKLNCNGSCVCNSGYIRCGAVCKLPMTNSACDTAHQSTDPCTGTCGACLPGFSGSPCSVPPAPAIFWSSSGNNIYNNFSSFPGNVGIGTATPGAKLDVNGPLRAGYNTDTISYLGRAAIGTVGGSPGYLDYATFAHIDSNTATGYALFQTQLGTTYLNAPTTQPVVLAIGGNEKMRLNNDGKVGIGTISPSKTLDINGDVRIRNTTTCSKLYTDSSGNVLCGTDDKGPWTANTNDTTYGSYIKADKHGNFFLGTSGAPSWYDSNIWNSLYVPAKLKVGSGASEPVSYGSASFGNDVSAPNNVHENCYWLGSYDIATAGTWGAETTCGNGEFMTGIQFRTGGENDELDMWYIRCCDL